MAGHLGLGKLIVFYDDNRITIDGATDLAESSPECDGAEALTGVLNDPPVMPTLWYRGDAARAVEAHERPESWGTHNG